MNQRMFVYAAIAVLSIFCISIQKSEAIPQKNSRPATKSAATLMKDIPLPKHLKCLDDTPSKANASRPECAPFYVVRCPDCTAQLACPAVAQPVYDAKGVFYPSPCWAERFGVTEYSFGWSQKMRAFIRDLWRTPKDYAARNPIVASHNIGPADADPPLQNIEVPEPHIEFLFRDPDFGLGPLFRSMLWNDSTRFTYMDIHVDDVYSTSVRSAYRLPPVTGAKRTLLAFVRFDDLYPESELLDFMKRLTDAMNVYFKNKQSAAPDPIQYSMTFAVIDPPEGVTHASLYRPSGSLGQYFGDDTIERIYQAALKKIGKRHGDFDSLIIAPIIDIAPAGGIYRGGHSSSPLPMPAPNVSRVRSGRQKSTVVPLPPSGRQSDAVSVSQVTINAPSRPYQLGDRLSGIHALIHLRSHLYTMIHELEHGVGMDHDMLFAGPEDTESSPLNNDNGVAQASANSVPQTPVLPAPGDECVKIDNALKKGEAIAVELPDSLRIRTNEQIPGTMKIAEGCLYMNESSDVLFDSDSDGDYEMIFMGSALNTPLQRALGWADIDGDGVAEIADKTPYGDMKERTVPDIRYSAHIPASSFKSSATVKAKGCQFEKVKLSTGPIGLVPTACPEFAAQSAHIYHDMYYGWLKIKKSYGTVLLPRLIPNALSILR